MRVILIKTRRRVMGKIKEIIARIFKKNTKSSDWGMIKKTNVQSRFESLLELAHSGNADAQFEVGLCYDEGDGVKEDKYEAFKWFMKAAMNGHGRAQNAVGLCYEAGEGVAKNMSEARRWFQKSVDSGCTKGMINMAGVYNDEGHVEKAWPLLERAARLGNEDAQNILKVFNRSY